jgi:hypothetical protein
MFEDILRNIPLVVTKDNTATLKRLKDSKTELYKEASTFALEFLDDLNYFDSGFCKKHNLDYCNNLSEDNINKIMIAYTNVATQKAYKIYKKIYRKRI